jgi:hypothetical protein
LGGSYGTLILKIGVFRFGWFRQMLIPRSVLSASADSRNLNFADCTDSADPGGSILSEAGLFSLTDVRKLLAHRDSAHIRIHFPFVLTADRGCWSG